MTVPTVNPEWGGTTMIIILLTLASIIIIILFYNYYHTHQINKKVVQEWVNYTEDCKINRYEKKQYKQLELWEIKDRLNNTRSIVSVYALPDDIAEEIIDYSLKLIEEERK